MIKNVRVEVVRNLDDMPTLAGLTESSTTRLLDIQQKVFDGLNAMPKFQGQKVLYSQIQSMDEGQKA